MDLEEFKQKFHLIKQKGFIPSRRKGTTGIGFTFEVELGLQENNISAPDLGDIELKTHRHRSNNLITLFTFNRKVWQIPQLEAIKKYGSKDRNGRLGLYYTLSLKPNSAGLFLYMPPHDISVRHISGEIIAVWQLNQLANQFKTKIPNLILVSAFSEERDSIEYFHYYRAQLMQKTNPELIGHQFQAENIVVDLRLHEKETHARNHGTGFRVYEDKLPFLFENIQELE